MYKAKVWYWDKYGMIQELEEECETLGKANFLIDLVRMAMNDEDNPDTFAKAKIYTIGVE